jgi:hypothetical protein
VVCKFGDGHLQLFAPYWRTLFFLNINVFFKRETCLLLSKSMIVEGVD